MKLNIFGQEADFDQLALATHYPNQIMTALGGQWSSDHTYSKTEKGNIEFNLFYNYEQDMELKELELIQFISFPNFHSTANKTISPLALYAPSLFWKLHECIDYIDHDTGDPFFMSHMGIHCSADEGEYWRSLFASYKIGVAHEDRSYLHTNPVIAGKRTYHNIIFNSREALGFDFKACIRVPHET